MDKELVEVVASFIHESKRGYPANFGRMHPKERDFWLARGQQSINGEAHDWAHREALLYLAEQRIVAHAMGSEDDVR